MSFFVAYAIVTAGAGAMLLLPRYTLLRLRRADVDAAYWRVSLMSLIAQRYDTPFDATFTLAYCCRAATPAFFSP